MALEEGLLTLHGERHSRWRAVDQGGLVLNMLVQRRRDKTAATPCCRQLLKACQGVPRVIGTDAPKSSRAVQREMLPGVAHRQHR